MRSCQVDRTEAVPRSFAALRLVVPHLGAHEFEGYGRLLSERIIYGTDFPNIPYAWDRELRHIGARRWSDATLGAILGDNARRFYRLPSRR